MASSELKEFTVRRDGGKDLRFRGTRLAWVDSCPLDHLPLDIQRIETEKPRRWKEYALYRTEAGSYVCHIAHCSTKPGETDRNEARVIKGEGNDVWHGTGMAAYPEEVTPEEAVKDFFGRDPLAKLLYEEAGLEDVEEIA